MPNHFLRFRLQSLSATIAHWYDTRLGYSVHWFNPGWCPLDFKSFLLLMIPFFLLGFNVDWTVSLKLTKSSELYPKRETDHQASQAVTHETCGAPRSQKRGWDLCYQKSVIFKRLNCVPLKFCKIPKKVNASKRLYYSKNGKPELLRKWEESSIFRLSPSPLFLESQAYF